MVANHSPGSAMNFNFKRVLLKCTKELSVVRGQAFLSSFKEILRLSSFHMVRMNETDSDHVVLENIQRRIKTKIWSAQLSSFNFFNP